MTRFSPFARSHRPGARARAITAGTAFGVAIATAALPIVAGGAPVRPQLVLAGFALTLLLGALAGWAPGFTLAAIALGTEYALRLRGRADLDGFAIIEATTLFATVELGLRSLEARSVARPDPAVRRSATWRFTAMLTGAAVSALVVIAVGSRQLPAPTAALAFGLAAAAALIIAAELVRRHATRTQHS